MHRQLRVLLSGLVLAVVLAVCVACMDDFSNHAISTSLTLSSPIQLGRPVTATVTADFAADAKGVGISLSGDGPEGQLGAVGSWRVGDTVKGQRITVSAPITFTIPGAYHLVAGLGTSAGSNNAAGIRVYVDQTGAVINPTPWPAGVPAPAAASKRDSPIPTATRSIKLVPPGGISTLPTPTTRPIPPDSNPSTSVTLAMLGPAIPGRPVTVTARIQSRTELQSPFFSMAVKKGSAGAIIGKVYSATLSTLFPGETRLVTQTLTLPSEDGSYAIVAFVATGPSYGSALYFAITNGSLVPNPTPWPPGVPAPAEPLSTPKLTASTRTPAPGTTVTVRP